MCGRGVKWRTASAGRLTSTLCVRAHLERSHVKLPSKVTKTQSLSVLSPFSSLSPPYLLSLFNFVTHIQKHTIKSTCDFGTLSTPLTHIQLVLSS